ncbi:hypothetical protein D3C72_2432030 [compost metagenome]
MPLATQRGASMPLRSYFSAMAKWVGLVMTTVAFGTSLIMRRRAASRCKRRMRPFTIGSPSDCLDSSLMSCLLMRKPFSCSQRW